MRNRHIVACDISDPARLRRAHREMNGFGDPQHYSVFTCDLSAKESVLPDEALTRLINLRADRALIIDLEPAAGRSCGAVKTLGRQLPPATREVVVV